MKNIILISLVLLSTSIFGKECKNKFEISEDGIKLNWTAYKTPAKAPVKGSFRYLGIKDKSAANLKTLLEGLKFNIDSASVNTKNTGRDAKIVKFFFQKMSGGLNIKGNITEYKRKKLVAKITMNNQTVLVPLSVEKQESKLIAKGTVDIFDFAMTKSLEGINKACFDLHEGKTWNDVAVELVINYKTNC